MDSHASQQRRFPAVAITAVLFVLCIVAVQFWVAKLFPALSGLVRINPSLVIFEIPVQLPSGIDMILVPGLFFLIYPLLILIYPSRPGISSWRQATQKTGSAFVGLLVLLFCMIAGGLIYYLVQDHLPGNIRNGINSFGMNADIYLPYPGYETIHLRGSTIIFACFAIGMWICIRKIKKEPGMPKAVRLTREQRMTPYERMMQEKRAKEKQIIPGRAPAGRTSATNGTPVDIEPGTNRPYRSGLSRLCYNKPVMTFRPEAVNYMPMANDLASTAN